MKRKPTGTIWFAGGLLLIAAALLLVGYNLWDDQRAARAAEEALAQMPAAEETEETLPDPDRPMPTVEIDGRDYIGTLEIPVLELSLPVLAQWDEAGLKEAPCRYTGSAYNGTLIVAGHNYRKHFGKLHRLAEGDEVYFTDAEGSRIAYVVSLTEQIPGTAMEEMEAGDWDLTLFTCTIGGKSRITVRCQMVEPDTAS